MDRDKNELSKTMKFKSLRESDLSQDASELTKGAHDSQPCAKRSLKWLGIVATVAASIITLLIIWNVVSVQSGGLAIFYKCLFFISIIWIVVAIFLYRKQAAYYPEKIFLVIVLTLTCTSSVIYDTNQVSWDVCSHYAFMLEYANPGDVYEYTEADSAVTTKYYPLRNANPEASSISESQPDTGETVYVDSDFWTNTDMLQLKDQTLNELDSFKDESPFIESTVVQHFTKHNLYDRIASIPGSLVFLLCKLIGVPFALRFILTKLVYALIYSFVLYFGMQKLRSGKMIFAVVALYPTAVFIAANYSYDYWLMAWIMYAVASIVGQRQCPDKKIEIKDQAKIVLAFVIGLGPKSIYFPVMLLCLLIPKSKFSSGKSCVIFRLTSVIAMLFVLATFCVPYLVSDGLPSDMRGGDDVNASEQVHFILAHPLDYAINCVSFIWSYLSIPNTKDYMIFLAYLGHGSRIVWFLLLAITLLTTLTDTKYATKQVNNAKSRTFVIVILLGTILLICTSLYVSFTPVGLSTINGVQVRYLLPLLFPFLVFMGSAKIYWPRTDRTQGMYNLAVLFLLALCNYQIIWAAYVSRLY